ncbi:hypothetical protein GLOIN_2v1762379 [Rhizophagus irregularis DAOM 181602=DAOM 197198]|uniref:Uncharacterized protein n=1 Tax=Rhizophagus irregularis (strain DAOM 181602 / DAOM 197198 / MUCL 43194) TaxID=747089 RepID=A0A2P4QWZ9_RHIID|nr:hypothetical protein GLOIN_2v1762379 [Rhizophagus irregularis DAOM 181602=DAOM 197198]POG82186.1 hypothetical protein GLOIN_2v1762379 [Rhizophagus irregularis DAOM 181602=DAOM 197198]GBC18766.2 hypothetical protein GLOIN_2v1762379 [Rhizophagus irregularis DAOM 181602=DAOM 197198]|eukprot:XP_025189052.1 hypothetical protein GLOIN_2v1762379 [Rhizophagus irregularis DAOM 181602=DAOM 197198]
MDTSFVNRENIIYEDDLIEQNDISSESEEDTEIYTMKHVTVKTIIHSLVLIEYSSTSEKELKEMEHKSVDPDSDLRLKINHELSTNKENTTFAVKDDVDLDLLSQLLNGQNSPPQPSHVPVTIRDHLQELIRQANDDTIDVTS